MEVRKGFKKTEVGVIPEDWDVLSLREICRMKSGESITSADIDSFSKYPCYGGNGLRGFTSRFTHDGQYALIGRQGALCGNVLGVDGKFFASEHAVVVTPFEKTDIHWLTYKLEDMQLNQYSESSAQPGLSVAKLLMLNVAFPCNKAEQSAIATALRDADSLLTALDELIAKKRLIKQGAMQELLTGKKRLHGFNGKWEVKTFGELVTVRKQKFDPRKSSESLFCVELEHIEQGTGRLIGSTETDTTASIKTVFQEGDVLFGKLRAYLRKYWLADRDGVCTTEIWALVPSPNFLMKEYLFQLVQMDSFIDIATMAYGTHMPRSDWNVVKNYTLSISNLQEQTAIAEILSDMDAEVAALETRREKTALLKQGIMQELLTGKTRLV